MRAPALAFALALAACGDSGARPYFPPPSMWKDSGKAMWSFIEALR